MCITIALIGSYGYWHIHLSFCRSHERIVKVLPLSRNHDVVRPWTRDDKHRTVPPLDPFLKGDRQNSLSLEDVSNVQGEARSYSNCKMYSSNA